MALQFLPVESQREWEQFLLKHSPQALFQSWLWGDVQKRLGVTVYRLGLFEGGTLHGVAQVFVVKAKRGTFLHVRQGPVFDAQKKQYWDALLVHLKTLGAGHNAWFCRVNPMIEASPKHKELFGLLKFMPSAIHAMDAEVCWVLDIDKPEAELLSGMRKTTRYEIRRGEKLGVKIEKTHDASKLDSFFDLYRVTSARHGFVPHTGIQEEFDVFAKDHAALFLAKSGKETLAGALILFYGNQAIYHHGASIPSKVPATYCLQWSAIGEAKKRGMKLYNFWGIAPDDSPNHPWRGITLFKKGFGGREIRYIHAQDFAFSPLYLIPRSIEKIRSKLKGY